MAVACVDGSWTLAPHEVAENEADAWGAPEGGSPWRERRPEPAPPPSPPLTGENIFEAARRVGPGRPGGQGISPPLPQENPLCPPAVWVLPS